MIFNADQLIAELATLKKEWYPVITGLREMVLSNMIMISQVPAQTFHEKERARLILERFVESGLTDPKADRIDNCIGLIPGTDGNGRKKILLFAHIDHQSSAATDQNLTVTADVVRGTGIAYDTTGLAVLAAMPDIIKRLGITFTRDIILLATTRAHGRGDFEGIRTFIREHSREIGCAINIGGITLGKIDYFGLSRVRCDISVETTEAPHTKVWGTFAQSSAIRVASDVMAQLYSIPVPANPKTVLNIGMISGGEAYSTISSEAAIALEVLSESDEVTDRLTQEIEDRCVDLQARHGASIRPGFFGRHNAAGLTFSHPLVKSASAIVKDLGYQPIMEYSTSEITIPLAEGIPSLHIGVTTGRRAYSANSFVDIEPIPKGLLQILMLLYAIDHGCCDDQES